MPLEKLEKISPARLLGYWKITEDEAALINRLDTSIDPLERFEKFRAPNKRLEWLAARTLIMEMAPSFNLEYAGLSNNQDGKPLLNGSRFELSITHSYPYVAAVIDKQSAVGIDLEQPKSKMLRIASKFLSDKELAFSKDDLLKISILWSAKEALYKIYSKRGLTFSKHLLVDPFELKASGMITGTIALEDWQKSYNLRYTIQKDFVLVFNIN